MNKFFVLLDILNFKLDLPNYLLTSPKNSIYQEVQKIYSFSDPINFSLEISRDIQYQNINILKFLIIKDFLLILNNSLINTSINLNLLNNYLFYYLFNNSNSNLQSNTNLYKNQYRPLKKGVTNMIKLHATGAIAMPIEIRLHILASSKDVIHSWAIPSAGIKIDCVPGYSSHRIMIFLVSGIF
jgi:heme/copper-type cytochrome/quinol oxidase subunit 2